MPLDGLGSGAASLLDEGSRAVALLAGLGLAGRPAAAVTVAGDRLDRALGLALLVPQLLRPTLLAQIWLVVAYAMLGTITLPWLWLDPVAPSWRTSPSSARPCRCSRRET